MLKSRITVFKFPRSWALLYFSVILAVTMISCGLFNQPNEEEPKEIIVASTVTLTSTPSATPNVTPTKNIVTPTPDQNQDNDLAFDTPEPTPPIVQALTPINTPSSPTPSLPEETLVPPTPLSVSPDSKPTLDWVYIPGGDFTMGSSNRDLEETLTECNETEGKETGQPCQIGWFKEPQRTIFVDGFEITKYEITNFQYEACVFAGVCNEANIKVENNIPAYDEGYFSSDRPVVNVNWNDANAFCQWITGRLPTEEEWEKAARGVDEKRYPWGNTFTSSKANLGSTYPAPVGSFPEGVSPYGVMDMAGNAFEWTVTWGERGYVLRGGGWNNYYFRGRVTDRGTQLKPGFTNYDIGFRCARSG